MDRGIVLGMDIPGSFDLRDRVALVTGAGSPHGIGFATAALLGRLGAAVMLGATTSRVQRRVEELAESGIDAASRVGDLTNENAARELVSTTVDHYGRLDILVNNAGMVSTSDTSFESGTAEEMTLETWQSSLRRNLDTAFLVSKAALPIMIQHRWGRIVMVASVTGPVMAMKGDVAYGTAKAGMVGLTRALAIDAADRGIKDGGWVWVTGAENSSKAKMKALVTERVGKGVAWMPFHFGGWLEGKDLRGTYPQGTDPYVLGESANTITTYGYDPATGMQEPKVTLCQIRAA